MSYAYLINDIGERRSPVYEIDVINKLAIEPIRRYYDGEIISVHVMSDTEWYSSDYPGHWVDDDGYYQN